MNWVQRSILVIAALLLLMFAFTGATSFEGSAPVAAFNFLAAVACLFLAARREKM